MGGLMDWYNQYASGRGGTSAIGSALGAQQAQNYYVQNQQIQMWPSTTTTAATVDYGYLNQIASEQYEKLMGKVAEKTKAVKKTVAKTGKILIDLRREIDDWHGDILMRAA